MTYQEYYKNLSLPPIPNNEHKFQKYQNTELHVELQNLIAEIECVHLQERIKRIIDRITQDYIEKHNSLIDTLKDLESSNIKLEHQYQTQSLHYQKALKEIELYRSRCNRLIRCSSLENSIAANLSSVRSLGCSSTPTSPIDDFLDPTSSKENLFSDNDDEFDISSILFTPIDSLVASESSLMPLEPLQKSTRNNENAGNKHIKDDTDILKFACSDGFWNTIAQGKSNKPEIDKLVRFVQTTDFLVCIFCCLNFFCFIVIIYVVEEIQMWPKVRTLSMMSKKVIVWFMRWLPQGIQPLYDASYRLEQNQMFFRYQIMQKIRSCHWF